MVFPQKARGGNINGMIFNLYFKGEEMLDRKEITQERIRSTLDKVINLFVTGDVPEAIARVTFPSFDVPSNKWSLANRLILFKSGTSDGRGWKQWKEIGRYVRKGEKAFYILAPKMIKKKKKDEGSEEKKEEYFCAGFIPIPVFAAEQTEGEELEYEKIELPDFPLMDKALEWEIDVKGIAFQGFCYGYYQNSGGKEKIRLATPEEKTFFHEIAHVAHRKIKGKLKNGQDPKQEIVAELSAQVLAHLIGTKIEGTLGNSYEYIQHYSKKLNKDVGRACMSILGEVEKVLKLILEVQTWEVQTLEVKAQKLSSFSRTN